MGRFFLCMLIGMMAFSCTQKPQFKIEEVTIVANDPEVIAKWYTTNLAFQNPKANQEILYGDFRIIFQKNENAVTRERLKEAFHVEQIPGFFKIGFLTNRFNDMVARFRKNNVTLVGDVVYDKNLDRRTLVVKDPEGNHVQIFEDDGNQKLRPYFISVVVESIGEMEKWYQVKLPIEQSYLMDLPERNIFMRILEGQHVLVELIDSSEMAVKTRLDRKNILGYSAIKVSGISVKFDQDPEGNLISNMQ